MGRKAKFTPKQVAQIRRLHTRGFNIPTLAEKYGTGYNTIYRVVNRIGAYGDVPGQTQLKLGKVVRRAKRPTLMLTAVQRNELRKDHLVGRTPEMLANDYGISNNTVRKILRGESPYRGTNIYRPKGAHALAIDEATAEEIRQRVADGATYAEMAVLHGVTRWTISNIVDRQGRYADPETILAPDQLEAAVSYMVAKGADAKTLIQLITTKRAPEAFQARAA